MKTLFTNILSIIIAAFFNVYSSFAVEHTVNQTTGTISVLRSQYVNNMNEAWNINLGSNKLVKLTCYVNLDGYGDFISIYNVDHNGNSTLLATLKTSNTLTTTIPSGKVRIVFISDDELCYEDASYEGFSIDFSADESYLINENTHITGTTYIDGNLGLGTLTPKEKLQINGSVRGSDSNGGRLTINTGYGTIDLGANSNEANYSTNKSRHRFNKPLYIDPQSPETTPTLTTNGNVLVGFEQRSRAGTYGGKLFLCGVIKEKEMFLGRYYINKDISEFRVDINNGINGHNKFVIGNIPTNDPLQQWKPYISVLDNGNIGINTNAPQYTLDVKGIIRTSEVKVEGIDKFADFVFDEGYPLPDLKEIDQFIQRHKHLPGIPSESEVKENGINLVDMQIKLLQKIEELTLYIIQQEKRIEDLENKQK